MVRSKKTRARKVHVYHATAPTCWWSWGYEAVMNRLPLVYGDGVEIHVLHGVVWEDREEYLKHYELTFDSLNEWARESAQLMGVPIRSNYGPEEPKTLLPATHAVLAALKQGRGRGERFNRAILRRAVVEGQDVTREEVLQEAAKEAGLNSARFRRDLADGEVRQHDLDHQSHDFPHLPIGFYNLAVTDGADRTVILDYAFSPSVVEDAIDYLSGGSLRKRTPADPVAHLRRHGPVPLRELSRVFGMTEAQAKSKLAALEKKGQVIAKDLAAGSHWQAAR